MERRLAAILAADVVGYSRLMGADETGTLERLKSLRADLVQPSITRHKGRIVKLMGDGLLAEFSSVVEAVRCADEIQEQMGERDSDQPADRHIRLRIGINLGDIIVEGTDIYGDGVNVASRLESLAEPGGICISGAAFDAIDGKLDVRFEDLGQRELKNIAKAVHVYQLIRSPVRKSRPVEGAFSEKPSIAVLPFENTSGNSDEDFFSDGITEDIINALGMWRSFPVIARSSSFAFKGKTTDIRVVGKELGAKYVLEGSVRRAADRVRVTAQLVDAESGHQLWADRFDRRFSEIFELQDELVDRIVAETAPEVLRAEDRRASQKRPTDLSAWELILRAMNVKGIGYGYGTKVGNAAAKDYLDQALALEQSSEAWAWRALCDWHDGLNGWVEDIDASLDRCIEEARLSVNADDANWLAHSVLGIALLFGRHQTEAAVAEAEQAVNLNPSSSAARHILGCALDFAGRQPEAIPHLESVFALDPRYKNRAAAYADLTLANLLLGKNSEAVTWAEKTISADPEYVRGRQRFVAALSAAGDLDRARAELNEVIRRQPDFSIDYVRRTYPFAVPDQAERFITLLRDVGVE